MVRIFIAAFLLAPFACWAHLAVAPHSMSGGFVHPLTGIDHLLILLAVGWISHRPQKPRESTALSLLFLGCMFAGSAVGMLGHSSHILEYVICISLILSGVAVVTPAERLYTALLLGVAGLCHGFVHGAECPVDVPSLQYLAGMVTSSAMLLATGRLAHRRIEESGARFNVRLAISTCLVVVGALLMGRI